MALRLEDKQALVKEVNAVAVESVTAVAAEYRGLTVAEMTELRKEARNAGVYLRVVKNTLARRAVEGTEFECMQDTLKGPILLAFAKDDPGAAARVIKDFAKEHDALQAVSLSAGGQLMPGSDLAKLADLPTLDQARGMLLGVLMAPMSQRHRFVQIAGRSGRTAGDARTHSECTRLAGSGLRRSWIEPSIT